MNQNDKDTLLTLLQKHQELGISNQTRQGAIYTSTD